jgi:hypothetical protein
MQGVYLSTRESSTGWALNCCPGGGVEESPDHVVAYAEQDPEGIPFSEHAARGPIDGDLPRHQIGAIVEGRGNNRGKGSKWFRE